MTSLAKAEKAASTESFNVLPCGTGTGETDTNWHRKILQEASRRLHTSGVTELQCVVTWHNDVPEQEKLH